MGVRCRCLLEMEEVRPTHLVGSLLSSSTQWMDIQLGRQSVPSQVAALAQADGTWHWEFLGWSLVDVPDLDRDAKLNTPSAQTWGLSKALQQAKTDPQLLTVVRGRTSKGKGDPGWFDNLDKLGQILGPRCPDKRPVSRAHVQGASWAKRSARAGTPRILVVTAGIEPRLCLQMWLRGLSYGDWQAEGARSQGMATEKTSREPLRTPPMKLKILHFVFTIQVHEQLDASNDKLQEIHGWGGEKKYLKRPSGELTKPITVKVG